MSDYGSYAVAFGGVTLGAITAMRTPLNNQSVTDEGGSLYDQLRALNQQAPVGEWTTKSIAAALGVIPQAGVCVTGAPGVVMYAEQKQDCAAGSVGASDHTSYQFTRGIVIPTTLQASRGQDATLGAEVHGITDGTNAPIIISHAATLPASPVVEAFVLGAIKIGDIVFSDIRDLNLQFGVTLSEKEPQLGGVWPDTISARKAQPVATFQGRNPQRLTNAGAAQASVPLLGMEATHANTIFYFKKRKNRAAFEADGSLVHLRITMAGLVTFDSAFDASGAAAGQTTVKIEGIHDGANVPLIITPNVAYDSTP